MSLFKLSYFNLRVFVCVWLQFVMLATNVNSSDDSNLARIINGVKVRSRSGKWPFMAAIKVPGAITTKCGGIVLNEDTILTAAHCLIKNKPNDYIVYIGHENIENTNPEYVFYPDKFIIHRNFDREGKMDNDIGVIKLRNKINIKNLTNVAWVCLPTSEDDSIVDTKHCYVIGWGYNENYKLPHDLFELKLPILDEEICNANPWFMKKYMLCAGYLEGGKDACNGDSGGPLVCPFQSDRKLYSLRGIVSFGNKCAKPNEPGYYTKVTNYLKWIKVHALD